MQFFFKSLLIELFLQYHIHLISASSNMGKKSIPQNFCEGCSGYREFSNMFDYYELIQTDI